MSLHPRLSLHQVAMLDRSCADFIGFCRGIGVVNATLVTPKLFEPGGVDSALEALAPGDLRCATVNHVFAVHPDLERDEGAAAARMADAIEVAARLGADQIYLITGGRGALDWEAAAARFAELIAPCRALAESAGVRLLVENASALNVDLHMAHTLPDAIRLAEIAGIGLCLELHACWMEGGLKDHFRRALPITGLVQASDYVLGDRTTPCRAVPGDGVIPLERLIGDLLDLGYAGLFDLELVGPRIAEEGPESACARAAEYLSNLLHKLGA